MISTIHKILRVIFVVCHISLNAMDHTEHMHIIEQHHDVTKAHGMYGNYPMGRDATGTSWMPESTPMPAIHRMYHDWLFMINGYIYGIYDHQTGPRGGTKWFSENMLMCTAQKQCNQNILAFRGMFSLEPGTIGPSGYPLLLQTGETANGRTPLIDRQHPHDLLMELAVVYTHLLSDKDSFFVYLGMPGEPALGPPAFIHRFSALFNPEAPITHHWLDSTHIQFGVATIGFVHDWFKIDASIFTGREPDQHRWDFEPPRFDSYAIRFSANTRDIAAQISYGFLKSSEQLEPCTNIHRTTVSLSYNKLWDNVHWQTTAALGINKNVPGRVLPGGLLESTAELYTKHIIFGRAEYISKDELFISPNPHAKNVYNVGKLDIGYSYAVPFIPNTRLSLGFVNSASFVPHSIKRFYGGTPFSYMVFLRLELKE